MRKPRLLDLYCKAGGAAKGYADAGFEVVGVDWQRQPRYPYAFIEADVLALDERLLRWFDAIHASPPCQFATALRHAPGGKEHPNLIPATRALLEATGKPFVIENVEGARAHLRDPLMLQGRMFGLGTLRPLRTQLERKRLFETNWFLPYPLWKEDRDYPDAPVLGVYGAHARLRAASAGGRGTAEPWTAMGTTHTAVASEAMGIDWMTLGELSEAVPPAYTRFIGRQLLELVG